MDPMRKTALVAGIFYLITFISIPTLALYSTLKTDPAWILGSGSDTSVLLGSLLELIVALAGIGTAVALYPGGQAAERGLRARLRHHSHPRGRHDLHRRREPPVARDPATRTWAQRPERDAASLVTTGASLVATYNWAFPLGQSLMPGFNALLLGTLLYRSGLVPRVLPMMGLIGAPLLLTATVLTMFGVVDQVGPRGRGRRHPDRRVGVLARRLPDRQGLQALPHHR